MKKCACNRRDTITDGQLVIQLHSAQIGKIDPKKNDGSNLTSYELQI